MMINLSSCHKSVNKDFKTDSSKTGSTISDSYQSSENILSQAGSSATINSSVSKIKNSSSTKVASSHTGTVAVSNSSHAIIPSKAYLNGGFETGNMNNWMNLYGNAFQIISNDKINGISINKKGK